jgi:hypothetical protein
MMPAEQARGILPKVYSPECVEGEFPDGSSIWSSRRIITQNQTDRLAHGLYDLTVEEIDIVEQESPKVGDDR